MPQRDGVVVVVLERLAQQGQQLPFGVLLRRLHAHRFVIINGKVTGARRLGQLAQREKAQTCGWTLAVEVILTCVC